MAAQERNDFSIAPPSPPSSSWAPFAPSAASIGWDSLDSNPSSQAGFKRPRILSSTTPQGEKQAVSKEKRRSVNNKTKNYDKALKISKKSDKESAEGYTCTWINRSDAVLTITKDCAICLAGRAQIGLDKGKADILGYRLDDNHSGCAQAVTVESPSWNSLITIRAEADSKLSVASIRNAPPGGVLRTFSVCLPSSAKSVRPTVLPPSWVKAVDDVLEDFATRRRQQKATSTDGGLSDGEGPNSSVVVCGAKGVGKSTSLRYIANRMLSTPGCWDCVAILDADVGQPELSPPGMITLTILRRPLLSPPHLHMVMGTRDEAEEAPTQFSYFFGIISPKNDPQRYLHCIQLLHEKYRQLVEETYEGDLLRLPLLVNTDGWVKGLGFQILSTLLADTLKPRHIIQIQGELKSKIFDLDATVVTSDGKLHMAVQYNCGSRVSPLFSTNTTDPTSRLSASSIPSLAWRSLRFCTYFLGDSSVWDDIKFGNTGIVDDEHLIARRLASMVPYVVPMEAVSCHLLGDDADDIGSCETDLWKVLNGSIVGLCISHDDDADIDISTLHSLPCVGLGIIRAIDPARRLFYVLTPLDVSMLLLVDTFVCGSLQLPIECVFRGKFSESFPFLSCEGLAMGVIGADAMKSRNNIPRRGFANAAP